MKGTIGLDFRPQSHGALHSAASLTKTARQTSDKFRAVLEGSHMAAVLRVMHTDEVLTSAQSAAHARGAGRTDSQPRVAQAATAEEGFEQARAAGGGEAFLIGRIAHRKERTVVRLRRAGGGH